MTRIIRHRKPSRDLALWEGFINRMFEDVGGNARRSNDASARPLALNVYEDDAAYTVVTALPGASADAINVKFQDDVLNIEAEVQEFFSAGEETRTLLEEQRYGKYSRAVRLANDVDADAIDARYENGVLTLTLPKIPEAQPRLIEIKNGKK